MRKIAWVLIVLLFLTSALLFMRYQAIYAMLGEPKLIRDSRAIAALAYLIPAQAGEALHPAEANRGEADFSLYLSLATALFAALSFIILTATHRRSHDEDDDVGAQTCPECDEPIRGTEIICRACGYRFGRQAFR